MIPPHEIREQESAAGRRLLHLRRKYNRDLSMVGGGFLAKGAVKRAVGKGMRSVKGKKGWGGSKLGQQQQKPKKNVGKKALEFLQKPTPVWTALLGSIVTATLAVKMVCH